LERILHDTPEAAEVIYRKGLMSTALCLAAGLSQASDDVQFNMDVLDLKDRRTST